MYTARKLGVPVYQLLGGKVRDSIKVYAWIGGDRPGDVSNQAYEKIIQHLWLHANLTQQSTKRTRFYRGQDECY